MTDSLTPSTAERLAALRQPAQKRRQPAQTSKILTAGLSATALLGMVAAMGWQAGAGNAQASTQAASAIQTAAPGTLLIPDVPAPIVAVAPVVVDPTVATLPAAVPVAAAPVAPPIQLVIPVAVPVAQPPVQNNAGAASNTATKASG